MKNSTVKILIIVGVIALIIVAPLFSMFLEPTVVVDIVTHETDAGYIEIPMLGSQTFLNLPAPLTFGERLEDAQERVESLTDTYIERYDVSLAVDCDVQLLEDGVVIITFNGKGESATTGEQPIDSSLEFAIF